MTRKAQSFLYVIGPDDPMVRAEWVKIGRSTAPDARRSQLQVGQGVRLRVYGMFKVSAEDAPRLESAVHAALAPLKMKGEVFQARPELACAFAEHIALHGEPDEFLALALARDLASKEWCRLLDLPSSRGRRSNPESADRLEAAEMEMTRTNDAMFVFDFARGCKIDEISGAIRTPKHTGTKSEISKGRCALTPRQPRTGPSLFKHRGSGGQA